MEYRGPALAETEFMYSVQLGKPKSAKGRGKNQLHGMRLYDRQGQRQYLTPAERESFLKAAEATEDRDVRTFCAMLGYTGCRILEALELTGDRLGLQGRVVVLESLKNRGRGVYRAVPVPPAFSTP